MKAIGIASAIALYAVVGLLHGGYYYNHHVYDPMTWDHLSRVPNSIAVGIFWPVYWIGLASIEAANLAVEVTK